MASFYQDITQTPSWTGDQAEFALESVQFKRTDQATQCSQWLRIYALEIWVQILLQLFSHWGGHDPFLSFCFLISKMGER